MRIGNLALIFQSHFQSNAVKDRRRTGKPVIGSSFVVLKVLLNNLPWVNAHINQMITSWSCASHANITRTWCRSSLQTALNNKNLEEKTILSAGVFFNIEVYNNAKLRIHSAL